MTHEGSFPFFLYTNNERVWEVGAIEKNCGRKNCPFDSQERDTHVIHTCYTRDTRVIHA